MTKKKQLGAGGYLSFGYLITQIIVGLFIAVSCSSKSAEESSGHKSIPKLYGQYKKCLESLGENESKKYIKNCRKFFKCANNFDCDGLRSGCGSLLPINIKYYEMLNSHHEDQESEITYECASDPYSMGPAKFTCDDKWCSAERE